MKRAWLLVLFGLWLIISPIISYAKDDSFCQDVYEKCLEEAYNQLSGFIATALALQQCDLLYYQCLALDYFFSWILRWFPFL